MFPDGMHVSDLPYQALLDLALYYGNKLRTVLAAPALAAALFISLSVACVYFLFGSFFPLLFAVSQNALQLSQRYVTVDTSSEQKRRKTAELLSRLKKLEVDVSQVQIWLTNTHPLADMVASGDTVDGLDDRDVAVSSKNEHLLVLCNHGICSLITFKSVYCVCESQYVANYFKAIMFLLSL